jgi:ABC-type multidrug transport system fused ATPase/permease subunit
MSDPYETQQFDNQFPFHRVLAQLELDFNSVERVVEYFGVPQEAPAIIKNSRPPAYWPSSNGDLVVDNLLVRYAPDLPAVLQNLTFAVKPFEKIGVVSTHMSHKSHRSRGIYRSAGLDPGNQTKRW